MIAHVEQHVVAQTRPRHRHCYSCGHFHGGRAYGLCLVNDCDCLRVVDSPGPVTTRTLVRRAARAFAELNPEDRAAYERAARRFQDSDLALEEFAAEIGLDKRILWRVRRSLRLPKSANGGG